MRSLSAGTDAHAALDAAVPPWLVTISGPPHPRNGRPVGPQDALLALIDRLVGAWRTNRTSTSLTDEAAEDWTDLAVTWLDEKSERATALGSDEFLRGTLAPLIVADRVLMRWAGDREAGLRLLAEFDRRGLLSGVDVVERLRSSVPPERGRELLGSVADDLPNAQTEIAIRLLGSLGELPKAEQLYRERSPLLDEASAVRAITALIEVWEQADDPQHARSLAVEFLSARPQDFLERLQATSRSTFGARSETSAVSWATTGLHSSITWPLARAPPTHQIHVCATQS